MPPARQPLFQVPNASVRSLAASFRGLFLSDFRVGPRFGGGFLGPVTVQSVRDGTVRWNRRRRAVAGAARLCLRTASDNSQKQTVSFKSALTLGFGRCSHCGLRALPRKAVPAHVRRSPRAPSSTQAPCALWRPPALRGNPHWHAPGQGRMGTGRHAGSALLSPEQNAPNVFVCVCVCVPRYQFQSCSNCEVKQSYVLPLLQTMSSVFSPAGGPPDGLRLYLCTDAANAPQLLPSESATRHQDTHGMHVCPTLLPTSQPHASLETHAGGGGLAQGLGI